MSLKLRIVTRAGELDAVQTRPLPDGVAGTLVSLRWAAKLVQRDVDDEAVDRLVKGELLRHARPHDDEGERNALFDFWRGGVAWRRDAYGNERIADTVITHRLKWGDCVDKSIGLAASFGCIGHSPYFVAIATLPPLPTGWDFNHVYVGVMPKGKHLGYDPTPEERPAGWESPAFKKIGFRIFPEAGKREWWVIE